MKNAKYVPKSGISAGKRNEKAIRKMLEIDPEITGAEIARLLGLSLPTVYSHLKKFKEDE